MVLPSLSAADLPAEVIWLHHFSRRLGSVAIIAMIALFILITKKAGKLIDGDGCYYDEFWLRITRCQFGDSR
ncbi:MAG: hypothetical protein ACI955_002326 [Zhongshania sp.]|jgi:hypothetical protein